MNRIRLLFILGMLLQAASLIAQPLSAVWPKPGQVLYAPQLEFAWNTQAGALSYTLTLSQQADLSNPLLTISQSGNTHSFTLPQPGTYYWRVEAVDSEAQSALSPIQSFSLFSPQQLPGLVLWLDAAEVVADAENRVSQWTDKSGLGHHVSQSQPSAMPIWQANVLNGNPALTFNGSTQFLNGGNILNLGLNSRQMFVVGQANATGRFFAKALAGGVPNRYALSKTSNNLSFLYHDNLERNVVTSFSSNDFKTFAISSSRSLSRNTLYIDGVQVGQNTLNPTYNLTSTFNFLVGAYNNSSGTIPPFSYHNGQISEIIFIGQDYNRLEIMIVENYLRFKYFPAQYVQPVNLGLDRNITYGFCPQTLDAGERFVSYLWNTGETTQTIEVNTPGTYSVTVTDSFGYQSSDQVRVSYPSTALNNTDPFLCLGETREIFPVLNNPHLYTYLWSTGATTPTLDVSESGSYWVQITDDQGCLAFSDTLHLVVDAFAEQFTLGDDLQLCAGNTLQVPGDTTGITAWLWSTGATTPQIPITQSDTYSLTVTNTNGCQASDEVWVEIIGTAPAVDFENTLVCLGDTTLFTDLSTAADGDQLSQWNWFVEGTLFAQEQNPERVFPSPGEYAITLVVTAESSCAATLTQTIQVLPVPIADFTTTLACIQQPYAFTDLSTSHEANPITQWHWDFGDGNISQDPHPTHTYTTPGIYTVALIVTAINGCQDETTLQLEVVESFDLPQEFTLVQPKATGFYSPGPVLFKANNSTHALTYRLMVATDADFQEILWDEPFNPTLGTTVHLEPGIYFSRVKAANVCQDIAYSETVSFRVFAPGVIDQLSLWVKASEVQLQGSGVQTWTDLSGKGHHLMQNTPANQPQWTPNVINGHPVLRFNGSSQFLDGGDILDLEDKSRTIFVVAQVNGTGRYFAKSRAAGVSSRYGLLRTSNTLTWLYHDNSEKSISVTVTGSGFNLITQKTSRTGATNQLYFNSILAGSNTINPVHNMQSNFNFLVGAYNNSEGFLPPSSYHNGDIAEILFFDKALSEQERFEVESYLRLKYFPAQYVQPIDLGLDRNITYGFCPVILDAGERFVSYLWSNGATTRTIEVNTPGLYSVEVTDIFGFRSSDTLRVRFPETGLNTASLTLCEGESGVLEFLQGGKESEGGSYAYLWSTGATTSSIAVALPGNYTLTVTDTLGCSRPFTAEVQVDDFPSTASLGDDRPYCMGDPLSLTHTPGDAAGYTYLWSTGATTAAITIAEPGTYSLAVGNANGCSASPSVTLSFQGYAPVLDFASEPVCLGEPSLFLDLSSVEGADIVSQQWQFGDPGQPLAGASGSNASHTYSQAGFFPLLLEVSSSAGCSSTLSRPVQVYHLPQSFFTPNNACERVPLQLLDASTDSEGGIVAHQWSFYNAQGQLIGTAAEANPSFTFPEAGTYSAALQVQSQVGCTHTRQREINVRHAPQVAFNFTTPCLGDAVFFTDLTTAPAWAQVRSQRWDFGDGGSSLQRNPSHLYQQDGVYPVSLQVQAVNGCVVSIIQDVTVHSKPVADFLAPELCADTPHTFTDLSSVANSSIAQWQWNFAEQASSTQQNPSHRFSQPGLYTISLTATSLAGCASSISKTTEVHPLPVPDFSFFPRFGVAPLQVNFTNNSSGASNYVWIFGDGSQPATTPNATYTFVENGIYNTRLVAISPVGCADTLMRQISVIPLSVDIGVQEVAYTLRNGYMQVHALLTNQGTLELDSLLLEYQINGRPPIRESWTGLLRPGQTKSISFNAQIPFSEQYEYLCVQAMIPGLEQDKNPDNDRRCLAFGSDFSLLSPYPVPAENTVRIGFVLPVAERVSLSLTDIRGHAIGEPWESNAEKGINFIDLPINHLRSGIYIYRLTYRDKTQVGRIMVR